MGKIGQESGAAAEAIHFGECALNQRFWQLKGGKVGSNARNMLLEEREMTQAKLAGRTKKKSPDTAAFGRKRLSSRKKSEKEV